MKTNSILIRLLGALGACMLTVAPLRAAPPEQPVDASGKNCAAGTYAGSVPQVQKHLNRIYAGDDVFKLDAGEGDNPLRDGILGPVTRKWLGLFCAQHPFKADARRFDIDVAAELARFGSGTGHATPPAGKAQAERLPGPEASYRYDPAFLRKPKDIALLLPRLRTLTDRYNDKNLFDDAVRRASKGLVLDEATLARIQTFAAVDGYMLPGQAVQQLKGASPELVEKLMLKTDTDYASADDFHLDLQIAMGEGPEKAGLAKYAAQIDKLAHVVHYRIPTTIAADLSAATELEPPLAGLYLSMSKVEYPSKQLLGLALRARVERALGMCPDNHNQREGRLEDEGDVRALWALVEGNNKIDEVMTLRAVKGRCTPKQVAQAAGLTTDAHTVFYAKLDKAAELVTLNKAPAAAGQAGPGALKGCGCAPDLREEMMTYGFYPLWTNAAKQNLDFDVLSRIGLYGMTIDDKGALKLPAGVNTKPWTLLEAAHRHNTKVDWVLYKNDWNGAKGEGMAGFLANLRQSIDDLLRTRNPDIDWRGTALTSFGLERGPSAGDGITLRFEGFPSAKPEQEALGSFVQALTAQLRAMKPARQLYLMVTQADIVGSTDNADDANNDDRPFSPGNLQTLMQKANPIPDDADPADFKRLRANDLQVLVLMQEPTAGEKLKLRASVENALFSRGRVRVLRNIIPVLEYDGSRPIQLMDDLIYFKDNFGGVGFWPLSFASVDAAGATTANAVLHTYFNAAGIDGSVVAEVIDQICPNRAWLRWLAWISSIVAIVAGVTLSRCRGCGTRLDSNAFYLAGMIALIVLPFLVIAALVVGDPLFKSDSGVHWFIAAILIGVVIIPGAYGLLKPARKLP
jgi:hypothetical protein